MSSVSVIIPCYNYGRYLRAAVESALNNQPRVDVNVVIIDDASPDGSGAVARGLSERHRQVDVVVHEHNRGHIATYNEGLSMVDSDYVVLLSADDLLTPGALSRAAAVMDANPSVGLVYGRPRSFSAERAPCSLALPWLGTRLWKGSDWIGAQAARGQNCIYSPEAVVRGAVQREVGGYNPNLPHTADLEMWLRVAAVADVAHVSGPDQALRRVHTLSMMQMGFADEFVDITHRKNAYESFFDALPPNHPAHVHEPVAKRRLAEEALEDLSGLLLKEGGSSELRDRYLRLASELGGDEIVESTWQGQEVRSWLAWREKGRWSSLVAAEVLTSRRRIEHRLRRYRWYWCGV